MPRDSLAELIQVVEPYNTDEQNASADPLSEWEGSYCFRELATCLCGQPKCMNLSQIRNKRTQRVLFPIGSSCIKRFLPKSYDDVLKDMTTCKCGNKKTQNYSMCHTCYENDGTIIRGQFTPHNKMDMSLKRWLLKKHIHYQSGELRRWLINDIKKTHRKRNNTKK